MMRDSQGQNGSGIEAEDLTDLYQPLPLVVGVTGHRDYDRQYDVELKTAVRDLLTQLKIDFKNTRVIFLSPMAPGADRLAAEVAAELDIPLYVPLPFPPEHLPQDFVTSEDNQCYDRVSRMAERVFFIGYHQDNSAKKLLLEQSGQWGKAEIEAQYAFAGAFVAAHCQILIALWDGASDSQTARTLAYKCSGLPPEFAPEQSLLDTADSGLWRHIYTPRQKKALPEPAKPGPTNTPAAGALVPCTSLEQETDEKANYLLYRDIDEYNHSANKLRLSPDGRVKLSASRGTLVGDEDDLTLSPALAHLREAFAASDVLAIEFKRKAHRNFAVLASLVVAATLIFLAQSDFPFYEFQERPWLLLISAGLLLIVQGLRLAWSRGRYQDKFQDYRALAEGLRIQFYWTLMGLPDSVADHYLRKQSSELDWIRRVFSVWNIYEGSGRDAQNMTSIQRTYRLNIVRECWVEAQEEFFTSKHKQYEAGSRRTEMSEKRLLNTYIGLMVFSGVFLMLAQGDSPFGTMLGKYFYRLPALVDKSPAQFYEMLHGPCILLIELPLIVAAALHLRAEKFALTAQAKQYERMYKLYSRTRTNLSQFLQGKEPRGLRDDDQVDTLIRHLGCESLSENADWVLMHRERRLEITSLS